MAGPKLSSKKRKRASHHHHPLVGIFTRSKSQIHIHRNRSGCSWSDSLVSRSHSKKPRSRPHSSPIQVKDLRSRRVFSDGSGLVLSNESGFSQEPQKCHEKDGLLDVQTTPPDVETTDSISEKQSDGRNQKDNSVTNTSNAKIKPLLGTRSRMKLFKAPGSFSYRRFLPYLMDVSKDYSCGPKLDESPKIEKGLEEKPVLTSHGQEILINRSMIESNNVEYVNASSSVSIESVKESSISLDSQKEHCVSRDFSLASISVVDELPQPVVDEATEKFDLKSCRKDQNLKDRKTDLSSIMENCDHKDNEANHTNSDVSDKKPNDGLSDLEQSGDDHGEVLDHNGQSNQEYVPMTLPDADICGKPEVAQNDGNSTKSISSTVVNDFWKPMDASIDRNNSCLGDKGINSSLRSKWVLGRCSRLKLFKVPGSLSYRRMLPFLIDVTEDNSCVFGKDHLKLEKYLEEKPILPSEVCDNQETPIESSDVNIHTEHDVGDRCATPITISAASLNGQELNPSYDHVSEYPKPCNSVQDREVHFNQGMLDTERKLGTDPQMMDLNCGINPPASSLTSLLGSGSLSREDAKFVSNELTVHTGEDCTPSIIKVTNSEKQIETDSLHHRDSSYIEASFHLDIPTTALKKGILKRTPRGCRGLCTCLNCSTFRLNAERAFEFSSNQMQDAEEVAFDLIKELSYMRNMLEKSARGADGRPVVCINQVKEACKRASEAEELAQTRLSQMNVDLKLHCRMTCAQRPQVRFANHVEEQVITYSDLPSK